MVKTSTTQQHLKVLEELSSTNLPVTEELLLEGSPNWAACVKKSIITQADAAQLEALHNKSNLMEQAAAISQSPNYTLYLTRFLKQGDSQDDYVQYYLNLFHQVIRTDTSILEQMLVFLKDVPTYDIFTEFLLRNKSKQDSFIRGRAAFILTSLIARAPSNFFAQKKVEEVIDSLSTGKYSLANWGTLDSLKNLMKRGQYRHYIWNNPRAQSLIIESSDLSNRETVYTALFCAWLITFEDSLLEQFTEKGCLQKTCSILKETKTEKVVRICIHILLNCLPSELAVEFLIRQNTLHTLQLLEYEKWRDEELYAEIQAGIVALQNKIKLFSNFDRYLRELYSGKLTWSFLHSEKFWHENVMHFEKDEFSAAKKLCELLKSSDPVTLAIACFDLGEFSRLYPTGKKIIRKIKAKDLVLMLMSHEDRHVSREALLCTQKMMLDNWKTVATACAQ